MPKIGAVIRTLREQRGMTQADLAQQAGLNQPYLSRIENLSRERVDARALASIARALDVSLDEIYIEAGLAPSTDRAADLRWAKLERVFRTLSNEQQDELVAIAHALAALTPAPPVRVIGSPEKDKA